MIAWKEWSAEAFAEAERLGAPVLLLLPSGRPHSDLEKAFAGLADDAARCVTVCADRCDRPDVYLRYEQDAAPVALLSPRGEVLARASLDEIGRLLSKWVQGYEPKDAASPAASASGPVWTGAVGGAGRSVPAPERPRAALAALLSRRDTLPVTAVELLLYAAAEWNDEKAAERLDQELAGVKARLSGGARTLGGYANAARLLWDAHAHTKRENLREAALNLTSDMVRELYDAERRAFRHTPTPAAPLFADENAQAVLALQRAASFEPGQRFGQTADEVLAFLRGSAYDPLLGMIHRRHDAGTMVYGLLGDNAWTILAFTEAFQLTGHKPHREFADGLARYLFQELWDRDGGGFLDRVPQRDDLGRLTAPRLARPEDNAAALEGLWRLHHLKGNTNYRRWLEWGLGRFAAADGPMAAGLAKVQDMLARGRLDLELIGRPGDPAADGLLGAVHRHYAPRRIVSFVDPDDQDYILAHKLEAPTYPRLFGCVDLRPVAHTDAPAAVSDVLKALS